MINGSSALPDLSCLRRNYDAVLSRVAQITAQNGIGQTVTTVAVTKSQPPEILPLLAQIGVRDFAENRVQALCERADGMVGTRHLIGHLQTNKVKKAVPVADLIQSVDSAHLAAEIDRCAEHFGKIQDILIQVNIALEPQKSGVPQTDLNELLSFVGTQKNLRIRGLMAIMPKETDDRYYRQMYGLYLDQRKHYPTMDVLSMGMSGDYDLAVKYGADMIRVGHCLFEE